MCIRDRDTGTGIMALTKIGEGTQTFTGANTYSGATTINKGILMAGAANTLSASSAVTIANDATAMLSLWGFSEHRAGWANRNLLLLNPLCLLLLPGAISVLRRRTPAAWFSWLTLVVAGCALLAWFLHWLPLALQYNQSWVALLLPVHLALAYVFRPKDLSS